MIFQLDWVWVMALKSQTKKVRFSTIERWDGDHYTAFFVLPQILVRHLKIGQETTKLHPLLPMCHEFDSRARQQSLGQHWQSMTP